ncbi:MAG: hypothetical protein ACRECF_06815 [Methyloceanibacter sp.]
MSLPRYFLIVGNTRVGSTWMQTSFHLLPGIRCRREIRWRHPYQIKDHDEHIYLESSIGSFKEAIRLACREWLQAGDIALRCQFKLEPFRFIAQTVRLAFREWLQSGDIAFGSKFKLDPYGFIARQSFAKLLPRLESDVYVFLLTRSYVEIFQSWKAIGIRHLANQDVAELSRDSQLVERMVAHHSSAIAPRCVVLTAKGVPMASSYPRDAILYPVEEAIEDLLVLFYNDIMAFCALGRTDGFEVVEYNDIRGKLPRLARILNHGLAKAQVTSILENPLTLKVEPDDAPLLLPSEGLRAVSDYLEAEFRKVRDGKNPRGFLRHNAGRPVFILPRLAGIFAAHPETKDLVERLSNYSPKGKRSNAWISQRPVYEPIFTRQNS